MATEDTEITLGAGKLLGLFLLLAATCGIFFAIGYSLGKTSAREQALGDRTAETSSASQETPAGKSSAAVRAPAANDGAEGSPHPGEPDLTFYKAVKQNGEDRKQDSKLQAPKAPTEPGARNAEALPLPQSTETRTTASVADATAATTTKSKPVDTSGVATSQQSLPSASSNGNYLVQIAAVSHEEDAAALAGALRKKSYSASVVNNPAKDKLFHVVLGPYATLQDAEAMKVKLQGEGYSPIVKR